MISQSRPLTTMPQDLLDIILVKKKNKSMSGFPCFDGSYSKLKGSQKFSEYMDLASELKKVMNQEDNEFNLTRRVTICEGIIYTPEQVCNFLNEFEFYLYVRIAIKYLFKVFKMYLINLLAL